MVRLARRRLGGARAGGSAPDLDAPGRIRKGRRHPVEPVASQVEQATPAREERLVGVEHRFARVLRVAAGDEHLIAVERTGPGVQAVIGHDVVFDPLHVEPVGQVEIRAQVTRRVLQPAAVVGTQVRHRTPEAGGHHRRAVAVHVIERAAPLRMACEQAVVLAELDGVLADAVRMEVEAVRHPLVRVGGVRQRGQDHREPRRPARAGRHHERHMVHERPRAQLDGVDPARERGRQRQAHRRGPARVVEVVVVEVHGPVLLGRDGEVRRGADPSRAGHGSRGTVDQTGVAGARSAVGRAVAGDAVAEIPARGAAQRLPRRARREDLRRFELAVEVIADPQGTATRGGRARRHDHRTGEPDVQAVDPPFDVLLLAGTLARRHAVRPANREPQHALHSVQLGGDPAPDAGTRRLRQDDGLLLHRELEATLACQRELEAPAGVVAAEQHLAATVAHERRQRPEAQLHPSARGQVRQRRRLPERSDVRVLEPARKPRAGELRRDRVGLEARACGLRSPCRTRTIR